MRTGIKAFFTTNRLIALLVLAGIGGGVMVHRAATRPDTDPTYVTARPERGMLIVSLSGAGQVAAENRVDIKPKVSGALIDIKIKPAQQVKKDDVLAEIDKTEAVKNLRDASQAVRDAQISLTSAKLSLTKLKQPPTGSTSLQAQHSVNAAQRALDKLMEPPDELALQQAESQVRTAEQNARLSSDGVTPQIVRNAYDDTVFDLVTAAQSSVDGLADADTVLAIDRPSVNVAFANLLSVLDQGNKSDAVAAYAIAKIAVVKAKEATGDLALENEDLEKIGSAKLIVKEAVDKTIVMLADVAAALDATLTSSGFTQSSLDQLKATIQSDRNDLIAKQQGLLAQEQAIIQAKNTFTNSGFALEQAQLSLQKLLDGSDAKDIQAAKEKLDEATQNLKELMDGPENMDIVLAQNTVDQRASALANAQGKLADAQSAYNDYTVRAPFDGTIAVASVLKGDTVGPSTAIATILGKQQIAQITLNEVDAAKIKVGQKATLTFDAIDGLSVSGAVQSIDTLGTVSQGVVSYVVKIGFDTQEENVRAGMSVSASIITDTKTDALTVPSSAVKASGGASYVEALEEVPADANGPVKGTPRRIMVRTGLTNDTQVEITDGLAGTEHVIVQTIQPSKTGAAASQNTNALRALTGGGGGGGANFRGGGGGNAVFVR